MVAGVGGTVSSTTAETFEIKKHDMKYNTRNLGGRLL